MRIVDLWLLCKMSKSRVVWPGLDVDRQVGIENNVYAAPVLLMNCFLDARINVLKAKQFLSETFLKPVTDRYS